MPKQKAMPFCRVHSMALNLWQWSTLFQRWLQNFTTKDFALQAQMAVMAKKKYRQNFRMKRLLGQSWEKQTKAAVSLVASIHKQKTRIFHPFFLCVGLGSLGCRLVKFCMLTGFSWELRGAVPQQQCIKPVVSNAQALLGKRKRSIKEQKKCGN